jgi:hypothetical protein
MKNFRFIAMTSFIACCMLVLGSQSSTFAQGKSGKSKGNSSIGKTRSTDAIQRETERVNTNHTQKTQTSHRNGKAYRHGRKYRTKQNPAHTNNGVRDHGRGIGRGKGQGKGQGYYKKQQSSKNH